MLSKFARSLSVCACGLAAALAILALTSTAQAATYTWDPIPGGGANDGNGSWDTTTLNWWSTSAGTDTTWTTTGTDTAAFGNGGADPYTVAVSSSVGVGGITFNAGSSYTISGGTIVLGGAAPTIAVNASGGTISSTMAGSSGLTKTGAGALFLTGANTYSGATTISAGTLTTYQAIPNTSSVTVASGATFDAEVTNATYNTPPATWYVNGTVYSGAGFVQTLGNVTLGGGTLSGNAAGGGGFGNYGNYTIIGASYMITSSGNSLISALNGLSIQGSTALGIDVANPGDVLTISSSVYDAPGGVAGITKTGSGLLVLSANNTYGGITTVSGGTLQLGDGVANNGNLAGSITNNAVLTFANPNAQTYTGAIGGSGALNKTGTGPPDAHYRDEQLQRCNDDLGRHPDDIRHS